MKIDSSNTQLLPARMGWRNATVRNLAPGQDVPHRRMTAWALWWMGLFLFPVLTTYAGNPIWINPTTCGYPNSTYFLGDSLASPWYVQFEIGQQSWNYAQVGYGINADGTGYNWGEASWYEDGDWPNKRVQRDIGGLQFTATGDWYWICQANESGPDTYTSASGCGWINSTLYPPSAMSFFTVSALNPATGLSAVTNSSNPSNQIDLAWTRGVSGVAKDTLILRSTNSSFAAPTQGTSYTTNNTMGEATVIYKGNGTSFTDAGLTTDTTYYYAFYAENDSYYSAAATIEETTRVVLYTFTAGDENGAVVVRWQTASEENTVGFYVERLEGGDWVQVNPSIVYSSGADGFGASYSLVDAGAETGGTYTYRLVEVESDGAEIHGPFDRTATALEFVSPIASGSDGVLLRWLSRADEYYGILRSTNLIRGFELLESGIPATPPENEYLDPNPGPLGIYLIRVDEE